MSTKSNAITSTAGVIASPQAPLISTFIAVILGASLIEFNEFLFPPKITSLNFWALITIYYGAIAVWFGITTMSRYRPYTDTFMARTWVTFGIFHLASYLGIMYFATRLTDSLFAYLWCWVALYIFTWLSILFRKLDLHLPEPLGWCGIHGLLALVIATIYSIWEFFSHPVPDTANWIFVFVAFAIFVSYRQSVRMRHVWEPKPNDQQ